MASSVRGQDESNPVLWLATRAGKMELSCPLGTTRRVPQEKQVTLPCYVSKHFNNRWQANLRKKGKGTIFKIIRFNKGKSSIVDACSWLEEWWWLTVSVKDKRGHIVAHDVSWAAQTGKHLLRTQNVSEQNQKHFCVPDTKFVSATNVARAGKRGNICVGNNAPSFAKALRHLASSHSDSKHKWTEIFEFLRGCLMVNKQKQNHDNLTFNGFSRQVTILSRFNLLKYFNPVKKEDLEFERKDGLHDHWYHSCISSSISVENNRNRASLLSNIVTDILDNRPTFFKIE